MISFIGANPCTSQCNKGTIGPCSRIWSQTRWGNSHTWSTGKCLAWDVTVPDTLASSHLPTTSTLVGAEASNAARLKRQKYATLESSHIVMPVAVETLGTWDANSLRFIQDL